MTATGQSVVYTPSIENFTNPERGWYKYSKANSIGSFSFLSQSTLTTMRVNEKITLMLRIYDLGAFKTSAISQIFLNNIQTDFNTLRASGVKCVLRFRYTETDNVDAVKSIVLSHIEQLKPLTQANEDVIHVLEAGFIGKYGEWYYTSNYGDSGVINSQQLLDRQEIGLRIMELTPNRLVMFRTPTFQRLIGGSTPISSTTKYNGSTNSRIGLHNDAFCSSNSDSGTFINSTTDYTYLDAQSKYTFCGGESNAYFPTKHDAPAIFTWLTRFHYNYLNFGYKPETLAAWVTQGCFDEIQRRLGYRFELVSSNVSSNILSIVLKNVGFSNVFNSKNTYLVFKDTTTNVETSFKLNTDIRNWNAGETIQIDQILNLGLPTGIYNVFLNIPDKNGNVLYSTRFANADIWNEANGYNNLSQTIIITNDVVEVPPSPPTVVVVTVNVINNIIVVTGLTSFSIVVCDSKNRVVKRSSNISSLKTGLYTIKITDTLTSTVYTYKYYKNQLSWQ